MIEKLDEYVGLVNAKIRESGLEENTIIIFTSDNGPIKGPAFTKDSVFDSNGPLRGFKRDLYEGGIRVPFVAKWPGIIPSGTVSGHPSAFYDFMATMVDVLDIQNAPENDGISYFNAMIGEPQEKHEYLYFEFHEGKKGQALVMDDWKAVRNGVFEDPNAMVELYNIRYDLGENTDIAAENPEIVAKMLSIMQEAHTPDPKWPLFYTEKEMEQ